MPEEEISTEEAARLLDVTPPTIRAWIEDGTIEGRQVSWGSRFRWRVKMRSVEEAAARVVTLSPRAPRRVSSLERRVSELERRTGPRRVGDAEAERDDLRARVVALEDSLARSRDVAELQADADEQRSTVIRLLTEALQAADRADELRRLALAQMGESLAGYEQPGHAGGLA